ncbi:MAG: DUF2306 domain-containing protein [Ekhidna sp.]|nr:DUF2306 domain-containing protein [Ekhidna sp.]
MRSLLFNFLLLVAASAMVVMASSYFLHSENAFLDSKRLAAEVWYVWVFKSHIGSGMIAILVGAINFFQFKKPAKINLHKVLGSIYIVSIFASSFLGLVAAQFATGGMVTRLGFSCLALIWFYTTLQAYLKVKSGNIVDHKIWMYRSYAVTMSAFSLRLFLLISLFNLAPFIEVYQFASWACWICNLLICELILSRIRRKEHSKMISYS